MHRGENCDPGGVPAGLGERTHEALAEHVVGESQNWDACGCPLGGANRWIPASQDYIHARFHQICRVDLHSLRRQTEADCIDYEVLTFDEAEPPQFIEQCDIMRSIARARKQAAEAINASGLLPPCDERPRRRRTAEQHDELAPSQTEASRASNRKNSISLRRQEPAALRDFNPAYIACRSKSVLVVMSTAYRFPTKNRHSSARIERPFRGISGSMHRSKPSVR
jgi:hypothetical protein